MAAKKTIAGTKTAGKKPSRAPRVAAKPASQVTEEQIAVVYAATAAEDEAHPDATAAARTNGASPAGYPDLAALGRENLAALARANAALVKGFEEFGQEVASCAEHSLVSAMDTARALVGIRTLADLLALNSKVAQATLEGALANSARLSEIGLRVASEALEPLNERVAQAFGRAGRPAR
jgi:hypothetical protein